VPYLMVPSPTPYDLPFNHNTSMTDRPTDRQIDRLTDNNRAIDVLYSCSA